MLFLETNKKKINFFLFFFVFCLPQILMDNNLITKMGNTSLSQHNFIVKDNFFSLFLFSFLEVISCTILFFFFHFSVKDTGEYSDQTITKAWASLLSLTSAFSFTIFTVLFTFTFSMFVLFRLLVWIRDRTPRGTG